MGGSFERLVKSFFVVVTSALLATVLAVIARLLVDSQFRGVAIDRASVEVRLDAEEAIATGLGFVRERDELLGGRAPIVYPIASGRGECLAAVVGLWGRGRLTAIHLVPRGAERNLLPPDALASDRDVEGLVAHLSYCADRDLELDLVVHHDGGTDLTVAVRVLRAPASLGLTSDRLARGLLLDDPSTVLGILDAGAPDAGAPDAGAPDAGPPDAGPPDAGRARGRYR